MIYRPVSLISNMSAALQYISGYSQFFPLFQSHKYEFSGIGLGRNVSRSVINCNGDCLVPAGETWYVDQVIFHVSVCHILV